MTETRVAIADDHEIVLRGLRELLSASGMVIVAEVADGLEAVRRVVETQPQVLILDLMMPGVNGLEVIRQVRKSCPATQIVVYSMHTTRSIVLEALRQGANGYVAKGAAADELLRAVREVAAGRRYVCRIVSDQVIGAIQESTEDAADDPMDRLTQREREVLHLAAAGLTSAQAAARLSLSPRTVEGHRGRLMKKLGLGAQQELVDFAKRRGLLPPDPA